MVKIETRYKIYLIIILIFAAGIYFYKLDKESLLTDEYFSLYAAQRPLRNIILCHQKEYDPNHLPPLYIIIMHFWLKIFGSGEFPQRSFSAILGIFSVYIIYRLSSLLFDRKTGILSCLFASLSFSWFLFFRQNRCYSLFICLTLLSFYLFFYYLKNRQSRLTLVSLIITNICLVYTHYFAFLVASLQMLFSLTEIRRDKRWVANIMLVCVWVLLAYLPWHQNLIFDIKREPLMNTKIVDTTFPVLLYSILMALFSDFHTTYNNLLILLYAPLLVIGLIKLNKTKVARFKHLSLFLTLIFFLPFISIYLVTKSDRARYFAPFTFPLFMFLALGIQKINKQNIVKFFFPLMIIFIILFNLIDFYGFLKYTLHENWKQAAQYIKQIPNYKNEEMIFVFQTHYNPPVFAYYYWDNKTAASLIDNMSNLEGYEKDLSAIKARHRFYLMEDYLHEDDFLKKLELFPENAWIWVFQYRDFEHLSALYVRFISNGRYFFHQIPLNQRNPPIDFFLLKKIRK